MISIECPSCKSQLKAPPEAAGRTARCKKCNTPIKIPPSAPAAVEPINFQDLAQELPPPTPGSWETIQQGYSPPPPPTPTRAQPEQTKPNSKRSIPTWVICLAVSIPCLLVGYFAGREHVKYEIRSAMQAAANAFSQGASQALGKSAPSPTFQGVEPTAPPEAEIPKFDMGQPAKVGDVAMILTGARIEKPELKNFSGTGVAQNEAIVFEFSITNTSERKILKFTGDSMYSSKFSLKDDVGNQIRGVTYGSSKPVKALKDPDINPGQTVGHVEVFTVPPPKTEYLILTVDLKCVDQEGKVDFRIPFDKVSRS